MDREMRKRGKEEERERGREGEGKESSTQVTFSLQVISALMEDYKYPRTILPAVPVAFFVRNPGLMPTSSATCRSSGHSLVTCAGRGRETYPGK